MSMRMMNMRTSHFLRVLQLVLVISSCLTPTVLADKRIKPEEVVSKHLESLGTAETRASIRSRIINGSCRFSYRARSSGFAEGKVVLASEDVKSLLSMAFPTPEYPHERVGFDGKKLTTGYISPGVRTVLGDFLLAYDVAVREGLFGGSLSAAWPLLDVAARNPKLEYSGTKTINGRETYVLRYNPRKASDVSIKLYFDSATFQHARTEYERVISAQMGQTPETSSQQVATRHKMVEEFSDFRKEGGLVLPHVYKLTVSIVGQTSAEYEWALDLQKFSFNRPIDANIFNVNSY